MEPLPATEISPKLGLMHQDTAGKHVEHVYESSPTALTLKFKKNLDSIPSTTSLHNTFVRFGPLIEWKTELLEKTKRAKIVFQRRCDAEDAFSSVELNSIFGDSLQSFRLKILPNTPKKGTGKRGRKRKNQTSFGQDVVADCCSTH
ncbi:PWWP domain protein [Trifolium medium]|uniref:PWWP domain protein n=1 Tax=Trifolium medium TaxID=97028 RepID=A0A392PWI4_9FABA|nr:PWWP domain protein [Trifolium medium]